MTQTRLATRGLIAKLLIYRIIMEHGYNNDHGHGFDHDDYGYDHDHGYDHHHLSWLRS